tara:strand:+ start:19061 stop:20275 length:1215 start_codon:yes stop_codon:yes gene_type:complete
MNPSSSGWINKKLHLQRQGKNLLVGDEHVFYERLRKTGFLYGVSVNTLKKPENTSSQWTEMEKTKVNLFDALTYIHRTVMGGTDELLTNAIAFYNKLSPEESFFATAFRRKSPAEILEKIIQERVQTNEAFIQKNFSNLITNALLFIDVIAFKHFLISQIDPQEYLPKLESIIMNTVWLALTTKEEKGTYDKLLLNLFEKSLRYTKNPEKSIKNLDELAFSNFDTVLEKNYIYDLACLAVWDDEKVDPQEYAFLYKLGENLQLNATAITTSTRYVHIFIEEHREHISYLHYSNPVKHFYNQTIRTVRVLILRNKKRLILELSESKELVLLLGQSTLRELSKSEKKKVKTQLLDICKSIPSLAIFLLPGGGVLLPLLIKLIPELLPSAFNENRIEATDSKEKFRS